jgi:hypothetical protein
MKYTQKKQSKLGNIALAGNALLYIKLMKSKEEYKC